MTRRDQIFAGMLLGRSTGTGTFGVADNKFGIFGKIDSKEKAGWRIAGRITPSLCHDHRMVVHELHEKHEHEPEWNEV